MSSIDDEIRRGAESDAEEVRYIRNYMGSECNDCFTDEDIYYCIDVMLEYFEKAEEKSADADGYIDIDTEEVAKHIQKKAKKEGMGPYDLDALLLLVDAELDYNESLED